MAVKKSQLYSTLWEACNALRGGMDASQYKDYVLVVLFLKYISDKAKSPEGSDIEVPEGCSFYDIMEHANTTRINEMMNKSLEAIASANGLEGVINTVDFADENKLGKGKDMIETVSKLLKVFQNENLNFANNRAADDDLIGDAYEYLMRQFASQSGKSKGQFYTPAEVSRIMANIVGINRDERSSVISIYDPACGSGSLLLRAKAEAKHDNVSIDGQEKDLATIGMARMSMIIHGVEDATLAHGDTLNLPLNTLKDDVTLRQFDYIVANPPFSLKGWMKTAKPEDKYHRWGSADGLPPTPPPGCGDYAFLLHIVASLKPDGKAAVILPHGVLFRGNDEALIREWLVRRHLISGIIGLPSNLFYGTGIPACIIIIDKKNALKSEGIFMIDAKDGYIKDGNKNRLREMDIRRIEDTWNGQEELPYFSRFVPYEEIQNERNAFNLNIPRYIAPKDNEIQQDITAHYHGGIPAHDVEEVLSHCWEGCPSLLPELFAKQANGYYMLLQQDAADIRRTIDANADYLKNIAHYRKDISDFFASVVPEMKALQMGFNPKNKIEQWGDGLLDAAFSQLVVDPYKVYDILRNYWAETMQDDCYLISRDGWQVTTSVEKKKPTYRDILCDLVPVNVLVKEYFSKEDAAIIAQEARVEEIGAEIAEMDEENPQELDYTLAELRTKLEIAGEPAPTEEEDQILSFMIPLLGVKGKEGKKIQEDYIAQHKAIFAQFEKVNKTSIEKRLKHIMLYEPLDKETIELYTKYIETSAKLSEAKDTLKQLQAVMFAAVMEKYASLTEQDIKHLVVDCKWQGTVVSRTDALLAEVSQQMASDIVALRDRYAHTLPSISARVEELRSQVNASLAAMGIKL